MNKEVNGRILATCPPLSKQLAVSVAARQFCPNFSLVQMCTYFTSETKHRHFCCYKCDVRQLLSEGSKEENIASILINFLPFTRVYTPYPCPCLTATRLDAVLFGEPEVKALRVVSLSCLGFSINPTAPACCGVHKDN